MKLSFMGGFPDMLKMLIYLFFRNSDISGYFYGREGMLFKQRNYVLTDGLLPFIGNGGFFSSHSLLMN